MDGNCRSANCILGTVYYFSVLVTELSTVQWGDGSEMELSWFRNCSSIRSMIFVTVRVSIC